MLRDEAQGDAALTSCGGAGNAWRRLANEFANDGSLSGQATLFDVLEEGGRRAVHESCSARYRRPPGIDCARLERTRLRSPVGRRVESSDSDRAANISDGCGSAFDVAPDEAGAELRESRKEFSARPFNAAARGFPRVGDSDRMYWTWFGCSILVFIRRCVT